MLRAPVHRRRHAAWCRHSVMCGSLWRSAGRNRSPSQASAISSMPSPNARRRSAVNRSRPGRKQFRPVLKRVEIFADHRRIVEDRSVLQHQRRDLAQRIFAHQLQMRPACRQQWCASSRSCRPGPAHARRPSLCAHKASAATSAASSCYVLRCGSVASCGQRRKCDELDRSERHQPALRTLRQWQDDIGAGARDGRHAGQLGPGGAGAEQYAAGAAL